MDKTWIIVQYDNRVIDEETLKLINLNKKYCLKHNYKYMLETKPYDIPPWWIKVKLVKEVLNSNKYKGVLWLDTDAVIHNQNIPIEKLLINDKSMYYSNDWPNWGTDFNAGVWLIKNDTHGNEIIETWMNSYSPNDWTKKDDGWSTSGKWAGSTYEQGAFVEYVKPQFKNYLHVYPWEVFQSHEPVAITFAMHFAGNLSDTYLPEYNNRIYYKELINNLGLLCLFIIIFITIVYLINPNIVSEYFRDLKIFKIIKKLRYV